MRKINSCLIENEDAYQLDKFKGGVKNRLNECGRVNVKSILRVGPVCDVDIVNCIA